MRLKTRWSDVDELVAGPATRLVGKGIEVLLSINPVGYLFLT